MSTIMTVTQFCFTVVVGIYFLTMLKSQYSGKNSIHQESVKELERLKKLNGIKLTEPLTESTRPKTVNDIVGQTEGIRALRAALCGENPQHVIIYGPPGVGKTAASRVVLEEAKKSSGTPFLKDAKFVEVDATTMQFDERSIADPLIGSVHDPIYQGAGAYGPAGVPQPKEGAVSRAHGGVLFIDEIGELHPIQMNKLLKVLEDRRVFFDSAYYCSGNKEIPGHIHEIFRHGLPADFRLIGATTRSPEEIPPALRSRCVEIFFHPLSCEEIGRITENAIIRSGFEFDKGVVERVCAFADNGRDAVNIIQTVKSVARLDKKMKADVSDVDWVIENGRYTPRYVRRLVKGSRIGKVCGVAVFGCGGGCILDVEAVAQPCEAGKGTVTVTGIVAEEEFSDRNRKLKRESSIQSSVKNVLTVMQQKLGILPKNYNLHINFPCSMPLDGPSAGVAILAAIYSAIKKVEVDATLVMTGEVSITGMICGVGEVPLKIRTAVNAGAERMVIPKENMQSSFESYSVKVIPVSTVFDIIGVISGKKSAEGSIINSSISENIGIISAEGVDILKKK